MTATMLRGSQPGSAAGHSPEAIFFRCGWNRAGGRGHQRIGPHFGPDATDPKEGIPIAN
jgi:hypothetical protein